MVDPINILVPVTVTVSFVFSFLDACEVDINSSVADQTKSVQSMLQFLKLTKTDLMYSHFPITLLILASLYTLGEAIFFGMLCCLIVFSFEQEHGGKSFLLNLAGF